jgi:flagellar biosynthetic protein FliQ
MSDATIVGLAQQAMTMALLLAAPMLAAALLVGIAISVLQAVTQIQEATLSFVPKLIAVSAVTLLALPWLVQTAVKYTTELLRSLPGLVS